MACCRSTSSSLKQVALIGPNAATARTLGGGSATVFPPYVVSPLDGLRAALGAEITIVPAVGVRSSERADVASKDLLQLPGWQRPRRRGDLLRCQMIAN